MRRVIVNDFNKNTHKMRSYKAIVDRYLAEMMIGGAVKVDFLNLSHDLVIDPFARNDTTAYPHTNDINPETAAVHHQDALEFLNSYENEIFEIGLLDPPFSDRMSKDKYSTSNLYASDCQKMRKIELQLGNLIKHNGVIIKFGYNSSKPHPGFECEDIEIWNLGACRNDIIVSVWRRKVMSLKGWN